MANLGSGRCAIPKRSRAPGNTGLPDPNQCPELDAMVMGGATRLGLPTGG
ncbi:MAG: hypothetical protein INR65_02610 [Gluconacetobacter diazotrophicus]|nr:hypothetical protein [Gluconacetobacter diazotrophicus]